MDVEINDPKTELFYRLTGFDNRNRDITNETQQTVVDISPITNGKTKTLADTEPEEQFIINGQMTIRKNPDKHDKQRGASIGDISMADLNEPIKGPDVATIFCRIKSRWYTNEEVACILKHFKSHPEWQTNELQVRPKSGAVLLYSREKVRYRQDGYCWKKRKNGRTTREDHMKLKVQGIECIYGCYVHSAILPTFHRRCYWLLENPDIVLVHYLNQPSDNDKDGKIMITLNSSHLEETTRRTWTNEEIIEEIGSVFGGISQIQHMLNINLPGHAIAGSSSTPQQPHSIAGNLCDLSQLVDTDPSKPKENEQKRHEALDSMDHTRQKRQLSTISDSLEIANVYSTNSDHSSIVCAMDLATSDLSEISAPLLLDHLYSPVAHSQISHTTNRLFSDQQQNHMSQNCALNNLDKFDSRKEPNKPMNNDNCSNKNEDNNNNNDSDSSIMPLENDHSGCDIIESDVMSSMTVIDGDDPLIGGQHQPDHQVDANSLDLFNFKLTTNCHTSTLDAKSSVSDNDYSLLASSRLTEASSDITRRCHSSGANQMSGLNIGASRVNYSNQSASRYLATDIDLVGQGNLTCGVNDSLVDQRCSAASLNPTRAETVSSSSASCSPAPFSSLSLQAVGSTATRQDRHSSGIEICTPSYSSDLSEFSCLRPSVAKSTLRQINKQRSDQQDLTSCVGNDSHSSAYNVLINGPLSKALSLDGSNLSASDLDVCGDQVRGLKSSTPMFNSGPKQSNSYFFNHTVNNASSIDDRLYSQSLVSRRHQSIAGPPFHSFAHQTIIPNSNATPTTDCIADTSATDLLLALNGCVDGAGSVTSRQPGDQFDERNLARFHGADCDQSSTATRHKSTAPVAANDNNGSPLLMPSSMDAVSCNIDTVQELNDGASLLPILDYSPNSCGVSGGVKVLIIGRWSSLLDKLAYVDSNNNNNSNNDRPIATQKSLHERFAVMFDDILVPATLIQDNVLKCYAPSHRQGFITLEVLHCNRIVSEQVLFEVRQAASCGSQ